MPVLGPQLSVSTSIVSCWSIRAPCCTLLADIDALNKKNRLEFRANADADPVTAGKEIAAGQKELKALHALLGNEHIKRFPGPPVRLSRKLECAAARLPL